MPRADRCLPQPAGESDDAQFTPFDLSMVVLVSEGVSSALAGGEESVLGGVIIVSTLFGLNSLTNRLGLRSSRFRRLVEGEAVIVGRTGEARPRRGNC